MSRNAHERNRHGGLSISNTRTVNQRGTTGERWQLSPDPRVTSAFVSDTRPFPTVFPLLEDLPTLGHTGSRESPEKVNVQVVTVSVEVLLAGIEPQRAVREGLLTALRALTRYLVPVRTGCGQFWLGTSADLPELAAWPVLVRAPSNFMAVPGPCGRPSSIEMRSQYPSRCRSASHVARGPAAKSRDSLRRSLLTLGIWCGHTNPGNRNKASFPQPSRVRSRSKSRSEERYRLANKRSLTSS